MVRGRGRGEGEGGESEGWRVRVEREKNGGGRTERNTFLIPSLLITVDFVMLCR